MRKFEEKEFKIEWIPVRQLSIIWKEAQRPYKDRDAQKIADNFDPDQFGFLWVTMPNGQGIYHIIEGQHRKAALEKIWGPNERAPCRILDAVDPARAAELFDGINSGRRAVNPLASFKVRRTAKYETEVEIDRIVRAAGYLIESSSEDKYISCVGALKAVYVDLGPKILADILKIIPATWGMEHAAVSANIIRGYGEFLVAYGGKINWQRLKEQMAKRYTPGRLMGMTKTQKEANGGTTAENMKRIILAAYNRGLPRDKHIKA